MKRYKRERVSESLRERESVRDREERDGTRSEWGKRVWEEGGEWDSDGVRVGGPETGKRERENTDNDCDWSRNQQKICGTTEENC